MSKEKAKIHFLGQAGHKKLNCGQALVTAFQDKFLLSEVIVTQFAGYGSGKAPEGYCGAFYAAKIILSESHPDKLKECEDMFLSQAGSTKCKNIRASHKMSCGDCVERVAQYLEKI